MAEDTPAALAFASCLVRKRAAHLFLRGGKKDDSPCSPLHGHWYPFLSVAAKALATVVGRAAPEGAG